MRFCTATRGRTDSAYSDDMHCTAPVYVCLSRARVRCQAGVTITLGIAHVTGVRLRVTARVACLLSLA
jgi:hypothetical protein